MLREPFFARPSAWGFFFSGGIVLSSQYPKLELKYCERCGGLWLRPQGGEAVYCASCAHAINELPPVAPRGGNAPVSAMEAMYAAISGVLVALLALADSLGGACA